MVIKAKTVKSGVTNFVIDIINNASIGNWGIFGCFKGGNINEKQKTTNEVVYGREN